MVPTPDDVGRPVNVRIPDEVRERLRADAAANDRTISQQIRYVLRMHYEQEPTP